MRERPRSKELFDRARRLMPGGVSSPVRAYRPYPSFMVKGEGSSIFDVDGNEYLDFSMGFGPLVLGHSDPDVVAALHRQVSMATLLGTPVEKEVEMADLVVDSLPSVDMIRLVNSGTEATMHAIRLARGHTGKDKVLKIEGAFHGAHDSMLVRAGSGATTHAAPDSLGVPNDFTRHTLLAPFNDLEAAEALVREHREDLAAVILEPVIGNAGPIPPEEGYLEGLREVTEENDVLLIFDEVITGFRLSMGGAQELYGVRPDLTVLGKVAGGGLPIGIFAGPEEIMSKVSPTGKVYQAGTFSGNPLTLAAGLCALRKLRRLGHEELNEKGRRMLSTLGEAVGDLPLTPQGIGSMFQLFFRDSPVGDHEGAKGCDTSLYDRVFQGMMDRGVYLPPAQFETGFLSTAHSDKDIDRAGEAMAETLQEVMG